MKLKEITPKYTAQYIADNIAPYLEQYVGCVCLFWDESKHYFCCMFGNDDGTIGLVKSIKIEPGEDNHVWVTVETCNNKMVCDIDNFYIADVDELEFANESLDWGYNFECDEDGNFQDINIEPIFAFFHIDDIGDYSFHELIGDLIEDLVKKNFLGKKCKIIREETEYYESRDESIDVINDVKFLGVDESGTNLHWLVINDWGTPYQKVTIQRAR